MLFKNDNSIIYINTIKPLLHIDVNLTRNSFYFCEELYDDLSSGLRFTLYEVDNGQGDAIYDDGNEIYSGQYYILTNSPTYISSLSINGTSYEITQYTKTGYYVHSGTKQKIKFQNGHIYNFNITLYKGPTYI